MAKKPATDAGALKQLKQDLKGKTLKKLYILHGPETYLRARYLEQMRRQLVNGPTGAFNFHHFTAENFDVDLFSDSVEALPMMAERSLVQVDDVDLFKMNESSREKMIAILSDLPDYCCVIFSYATMAYHRDGKQRRLCTVLDQQAQVIAFEKQSERDLAAWISRHVQQHKKVISNELCFYLIELTDASMTTMDMEIEKITAYAAGQEITKQDIDAVVEPVLNAVVFRMTDAIAERRFDAAIQQLNDLFKMQEEPIVILAAIGSQMRRLYAARTLMDCGKGADSLPKVYPGMGDYPARKLMGCARKFSTASCKKAMLLCAQTDYQLKTSYDVPERLLELLIMQLAQEADND